jgi:hypothetical protein
MAVGFVSGGESLSQDSMETRPNTWITRSIIFMQIHFGVVGGRQATGRGVGSSTKGGGGACEKMSHAWEASKCGWTTIFFSHKGVLCVTSGSG